MPPTMKTLERRGGLSKWAVWSTGTIRRRRSRTAWCPRAASWPSTTTADATQHYHAPGELRHPERLDPHLDQPQGSVAGPRRRRFRRRPAGRARRERPGSRSSSPGTREGRPCDRRPRAVPGRGRTPRGEPPGGELPVDDQAQHMAIEAAPVRIAGAQKDPAAQNVHAAIPASRRVARKVIENARGDQDNPVILTISPGWLEVMVVLSP
jgi:hypothetical protein